MATNFGQFSNAPNLGQRMATTAANLIGLYGDQNVTFTRTLPGAFNPATGITGAPLLWYYTTQGISSQFTQAEMTRSNVQYGDLKYIIYPPADGTIPQVGDTVTLNNDDNVSYRIMNVINNNLQGTVMYFELQLRV